MTNINQQDLITILGLESLPEERKVQLVQQATELIENRLVARVMDSLAEAERAEFEVILDTGTDKQVADYLASKLPQSKSWAEEEVAKFKSELAGQQPALD